jgi:AsmA protein
MKILLWIIGSLAALVIAAAVLIPLILDEQKLIELAARQVEEQSGVKVTVDGEASLSLFPRVALTTSDVTVQMPDKGPRVEANFLQAGVALMPLLRRSVEMDSITVQGLTVTSIAVDDAAARVAEMDTSTLSAAELDAFYAARERAREAAAAQASLEVLTAPLALEVGQLNLEDIRLRTVDSDGALISELQLKYLTASDLNTAGRAIPITGEVLISGAETGDSVRVTLEGQATIDQNSGQATLSAFDVVVEGATVDPLRVLASGEADLSTQVAQLDITLSSGTLSGDGTVRYASFESPMIDATLALTELNPALLLLAGPEAASAPREDAADAGEGAAETALPLHTLRLIDTRAQLTIDSVILEGHRLEDVEASLRVVDGMATLKPVTATLHGGDIDFEAVFNGRYNTARVRSSGGIRGMDVGQAVAAMEIAMGASGSAELTWSVEGEGRSSEALVQSLQGPIDFSTDDITLQGIAMERMFCRGIALVNQESLVAEFPEDTTFQALSAKVQLQEGVATLAPLTATLPAVRLNGNGALDLESQRLQASLRAQLSPQLGEIDPACRVNERYAEIRWPVECRGTLADDPASWCNVNTTEIVKDLAENEAKRKVKEEAGKLLNKLFD